jgi:hypothetical protein
VQYAFRRITLLVNGAYFDSRWNDLCTSTAKLWIENLILLKSARGWSGRKQRFRGTCQACLYCGGQPGFHTELAEDVLQMLLYGARADAKAGANLGVGLSASDP